MGRRAITMIIPDTRQDDKNSNKTGQNRTRDKHEAREIGRAVLTIQV
jgi:hypothetical protein